MIWILITVYTLSCIWYWYEIHIEGAETTLITVIGMFIPLFNLPYPIMRFMLRITADAFFRIDPHPLKTR